MEKFKLELTGQEVSLILASLRKQPMELVEKVVGNIAGQINSQMKKPAQVKESDPKPE